MTTSASVDRTWEDLELGQLQRREERHAPDLAAGRQRQHTRSGEEDPGRRHADADHDLFFQLLRETGCPIRVDERWIALGDEREGAAFRTATTRPVRTPVTPLAHASTSMA